jgi:hypothetical protein
MTKRANSTPDDVVKAFRKAASELGCSQSERRFQETLFEIGRHKPEKRLSNKARRVSSRINSLAADLRPRSSSK